MEGWIKTHRKLLDNPIVCKDAEHLAVWMYLLLNATHKELPAVFNGNKITLQPGQLITGRNSISERLSVHDSKVQRILKRFETEHQIEQQTGNKNRLVSILRWSEYQSGEQQNDEVMNNKRTTTEQQLNTNKNVKNVNNEKEVIPYVEIIDYLNAACDSKFSSKSDATNKLINGRWSEGYRFDDFKYVIDIKAKEWLGTEHEKYLRPTTLFIPSKFESYMNQKPKVKIGKHSKQNGFQHWETPL